jgi:hypothetical protein
MQRREFLTLLAGSAASMPVAARAQQPAAMPVVGFLDGGSPRERTQQVAAFRKGLAEGGYQEGDARWNCAGRRVNTIDSLSSLLIWCGVE